MLTEDAKLLFDGLPDRRILTFMAIAYVADRVVAAPGGVVGTNYLRGLIEELESERLLSPVPLRSVGLQPTTHEETGATWRLTPIGRALLGFLNH